VLRARSLGPMKTQSVVSHIPCIFDLGLLGLVGERFAVAYDNAESAGTAREDTPDSPTPSTAAISPAFLTASGVSI
jgi:hypothetical protein